MDSINSLNRYKYSGHAYTLGNLSNDWQDTKYLLSWFGRGVKNARRAYLDFVREGTDENERAELGGGGLLRAVGGWKGLSESRKRGEFILGDERVLGDSEFVKKTLKTQESAEEKEPDRLKSYNLDKLCDKTCRYFSVDARDVRSASKKAGLRQARSAICYIATRELKIKGMDVAAFLGLSESTVSKLISRFSPDESHEKLIGYLIQPK